MYPNCTLRACQSHTHRPCFSFRYLKDPPALTSDWICFPINALSLNQSIFPVKYNKNAGILYKATLLYLFQRFPALIQTTRYMKASLPLAPFKRKQHLTPAVQIPVPFGVFFILEMFPGVFMYLHKPGEAILYPNADTKNKTADSSITILRPRNLNNRTRDQCGIVAKQKTAKRSYC